MLVQHTSFRALTASATCSLLKPPVKIRMGPLTVYIIYHTYIYLALRPGRRGEKRFSIMRPGLEANIHAAPTQYPQQLAPPTNEVKLGSMVIKQELFDSKLVKAMGFYTSKILKSISSSTSGVGM